MAERFELLPDDLIVPATLLNPLQFEFRNSSELPAAGLGPTLMGQQLPRPALKSM